LSSELFSSLLHHTHLSFSPSSAFPSPLHFIRQTSHSHLHPPSILPLVNLDHGS
jgi:hypothetical protein